MVSFGSNNNMVLLVLLAVICNTFSARIDPKLDFSEMAKVTEVRDGNSRELRPIVRGVRVTVEAMTDNKASPESKSSESSDSESSDRSSSVGVRTDVTFDLSNESNETRSDEEIGIGRNKTKSDKDKKDKDDDREVPVIIGRPTPTKSPDTNEITTWKPKVRPLYPTDNHNGAPVPNNWFHNFPPEGVWTTERTDYRYGGYEIYPRSGIPTYYKTYYPQRTVGSGWKPCKCDTDRPWRPIDSVDLGFERSHEHLVDSKLEAPFY